MNKQTHLHSDLPPYSYLDSRSLNSQIIAPALIAYAAGDAFGVQFEFAPRRAHIIDLLEEKEGWPLGGVSDDTFLSLLTIESLTETNPMKAAARFLENLRRDAPKLRGLGPTTRTALGMEVKENERGVIGNTNGAMMRTALSGLAFSPSSAALRREWITESARTTHSHVSAISCAVLMAAAFSEATHTDAARDCGVLEALNREIDANDLIPHNVVQAIHSFDTWMPSEEGTSLDPLETLLAVLWSSLGAKDCKDVFSRACSLGGDTDTVAALAGALYCAWNPTNHGLFSLQWLPQVQWSEIAHIKQAIELIITMRESYE
jgi:ADP-ribosylglycohydrolase